MSCFKTVITFGQWLYLFQIWKLLSILGIAAWLYVVVIQHSKVVDHWQHCLKWRGCPWRNWTIMSSTMQSMLNTSGVKIQLLYSLPEGLYQAVAPDPDGCGLASWGGGCSWSEVGRLRPVLSMFWRRCKDSGLVTNSIVYLLAFRNQGSVFANTWTGFASVVFDLHQTVLA